MRPKFIVGQRVMVIWASAMNAHLRNLVGEIVDVALSPYGNYDYTVRLEKLNDHVIARQSCLAPLLYDGYKKTSWAESPWRPKETKA